MNPEHIEEIFVIRMAISAKETYCSVCDLMVGLLSRLDKFTTAILLLQKRSLVEHASKTSELWIKLISALPRPVKKLF